MTVTTMLATQSLLNQSVPLELAFSLSSLNPIMQIGLAFLLAYLNLEGFRYRKDVPKVAKNALNAAKTESGLIDNIESYDEYESLQFLEKIAKDECDVNSIKVFKGFKDYFLLQSLIIYFCKNRDRHLALASAIILSIFLIIDTKYFADIYTQVNNYPNTIFFSIIFFGMVPVLNILGGWWMNRGLINITTERTNELNKTIKTLKKAKTNKIQETSENFKSKK